jgi:SAM-dependent methyltransferase
MPEDHFGEAVAARYDENLGEMGTAAAIDPAVDFLAAQAGGGPALEFAVGTGRIAVPLHERGVPVRGIDLSAAMLARLRARTAEIEVVEGDMTTVRVPGRYRLVYLVFNTIGNLTTQDAQVACFRNAADHLDPGGRFVVEVGVPQLQRLPPGETHRLFDVSATHIGLDEIDTATQRLVSHHWSLDGDRVRVDAVPFRYVWPAELDLMARLAGMTLRERWSDWDRTPFTGDSRKHVSVWEKP